MYRAKALSAILFTILVGGAFLFFLMMAGCGGGGGGGSDEPPPPDATMVTITGRVDDGTANSPIANARCRYRQEGGTQIPVIANALGEYRMQTAPGVQGFLSCVPPNLPNLSLVAFVSTEGQAEGSMISDKEVAPRSTIIAELLKQVPSSIRTEREAELRQRLEDGDANLMALVDELAELYSALFKTNVDVDFTGDAEGEADADGGVDGGAEGDAGDGAEASPIPNAMCDFSLTIDGEAFVNSVLSDLFDNGRLDRPDLAPVADQVVVEDPQALVTAYRAVFPNGISRDLITSANPDGHYRLMIPAGVPGYVRCRPPDLAQLHLVRFVRSRALRQKLVGQNVTPQQTIFSTVIAPSGLNDDVATAQDNFEMDIAGLRVGIERANGAIAGFRVVDPVAVEDNNVSLVAFSATALYNILFKNNFDADYLIALNDFVEKKEVDPVVLEMLGVPTDQTENLSNNVNDSVDVAEQDLDTTLEEALATSRIRVTVTDTAGGPGIAGALVDVQDGAGQVTCVECPGTTDASGMVTLTLANVPPGGATAVNLEVSVDGGMTRSTTEVVAFATVDTEVSLSDTPLFTLTVIPDGDGNGTVTSSPAGINCGGDCQEDYVEGTQVTLTATPLGTSRFTGWSGACSGTGGCVVTMNSPQSVTATFAGQAAPVISNLNVSVTGLNDCDLGDGDAPGSSQQGTFDYTDEDGDVTANGVVHVEFVFDDGSSGAFDVFPSFSDGFGGSVSISLCTRFASTTSITRTFTLIDSSGNVSNALMATISRPPGANSVGEVSSKSIDTGSIPFRDGNAPAGKTE